MQRVVGVKFKQVGKTYFFSPSNDEVKKNDLVIVESGDGQEFGFVDFVEDMEENKIPEKLKPVVRKATNEDEKKYNDILKKIPEYKSFVDKKVEELKLDMKVVNIEIMNLGNKVLVEFISDNRVDFRELLKLLASNFKARIELKQIGQRDEVKEKGALGICGQECCCKRFLKDFEHVSIKMAKNQNLSLNPTKISGVCGKLLCCLGYEDEFYAEAIKNMPKINQDVQTPDGDGKAIYNDVLKQVVTVKLSTKDSSLETKTYPLEQVKFARHKQNNEENKGEE